MFVTDTVPAEYQDPWRVTLRTRLDQAVREQTRTAYVYERPDNSTFRYRVFNMQQSINSSPLSEESASYFFLSEIDFLCREIDNFSRIVLCRCRYNHKFADLINIATAKGIPVLFDVDDLVFDCSLAHLLIDTLDLDPDDERVWDDWFSYTSRMGELLRMTDGCISTNQHLAAEMKRFSGKDTAVIPNFLNFQQLNYSSEIFDCKYNLEFKTNNLFHIGYFSGTPSHARDFEIVKPTINRLLANFPDIHLFVVGYLNIDDLKAQFPNKVIQYGLHDFVNLQRLISLAEVNIVPLQNNIFTNSKSELKFFEAAIVGTVTIASPTYTYSRCITEGETGFLARDHEWYDKIKSVYDNMHDYRRIAMNARKYALDMYSGEIISSSIRDVLHKWRK